MTRLGLLLAAGCCSRPVLRPDRRLLPACRGRRQSEPTWVLFDLGSAVQPEFKPAIAQAAATAKARQVTKVCVVGQTDKLGDKNYNAKLAQARRRPSPAS